MNQDLDMWWCSLPTVEKEDVARCGAEKDATNITYPACTTWWLALSDEGKRSARERHTKSRR